MFQGPGLYKYRNAIYLLWEKKKNKKGGGKPHNKNTLRGCNKNPNTLNQIKIGGEN